MMATGANAANLVANASGNMSAAIWSTVNNSAAPDSFTGSNSLSTLSRVYTNYFTPTAGDAWDGGVFYVYSVQGTGNVACDLWDGASKVASSTISFSAATTSTGPCGGYVWFRPPTPYAYTSVTPSNWRMSLYNPNGVNIYFRQNTTNQLAYMEVTTRTAVSPSTNDSLFIVGSATNTTTPNAGLTNYVVTVDTSITLGTAGVNVPAIGIGVSGSLKWPVTASTYTLTLNNDIRVCGSSPTGYGFEMGSAAAPLHAGSTMTLVFNLTTTGQYGLIYGDGALNYYGRNYTPPRISICGTNSSLWRDSLSANYNVSATSVTTTNNLGIANGAKLLLGSTSTSLDAEVVTVTSTTGNTCWLSAGLTYQHAQGGLVWVIDDIGMAKIRSSNASYMTKIYGNGAFQSAANTYATQPTVEVTNLAMQYAYAFNTLGTSTSSYATRVSLYQSAGQDTPFGLSNGLMTKMIYFGSANLSGGINVNCSSCTYANTANAGLNLTYPNAVYSDLYCDGGYVYFNSSNATFNRPVTQANGTRSYYGNANVYNIRIFSPQDSTPVVNTDFLSGGYGYVNEQKYFNLSSSATTILNTTWLQNSNAGTNIYISGVAGNGNDIRIGKAEGIWTTSGAGLTDTTTKTAGKISWKGSPFSFRNYSVDTFYFKPQSLAVKNGQSMTLQGYMRKGSTFNGTPRAYLQSDDFSVNTSYSLTGAADAWEFFSLSGVVSSDTGIQPKFECEATAGNCYYADLLMVIGDTTAGTATGFELQKTADAIPTWTPLGGTIERTYFVNMLNTSTVAYVSDVSNIAAGITSAQITQIATTTVDSMSNFTVSTATSTTTSFWSWLYRKIQFLTVK